MRPSRSGSLGEGDRGLGVREVEAVGVSVSPSPRPLRPGALAVARVSPCRLPGPFGSSLPLPPRRRETFLFGLPPLPAPPFVPRPPPPRHPFGPPDHSRTRRRPRGRARPGPFPPLRSGAQASGPLQAGLGFSAPPFAAPLAPAPSPVLPSGPAPVPLASSPALLRAPPPPVRFLPPASPPPPGPLPLSSRSPPPAPLCLWHMMSSPLSTPPLPPPCPSAFFSPPPPPLSLPPLLPCPSLRLPLPPPPPPPPASVLTSAWNGARVGTGTSRISRVPISGITAARFGVMVVLPGAAWLLPAVAHRPQWARSRRDPP